jgi:hypothetical protein
LSGCGVPSNECEGGQSQCDGEVAMSCTPVETGSGTYYAWSKTACAANACKLDAQTGQAFCALSPEPDPRCDSDRASFCDGTTIVSCESGYVTSRSDCAVPSSSRPGTGPFCADIEPDPEMALQMLSALCVAEPERNPECPSGTVQAYNATTCSGNDLLQCIDGFLLQRQSCGDAFCTADAFCSLTKEPDPSCPPNQPEAGFCDGNVVVLCNDGFRVSETPCAAPQTCGTSSWPCSGGLNGQCTRGSCQ